MKNVNESLATSTANNEQYKINSTLNSIQIWLLSDLFSLLLHCNEWINKQHDNLRIDVNVSLLDKATQVLKGYGISVQH